jgi:hypothetical protein
MRRYLAVTVVAVAVASTLAGCGGSSHSSAGAAHRGNTGGVSSAVAAQARLLTVADMPPGWTADTDDSTPGDGSGPGRADGNPFVCPTPLPAALRDAQGTGDSADPQVRYIGDRGENFSETVSVVPTTSAAARGFGVITKYLTTCTGFTEAGFTGTMAPFSLPAIGDGALGLQVTIDFRGLPLAVDLVLARSGQDLIVMEHAAEAPLAHNLTTLLAQRAIDRLDGATNA